MNDEELMIAYARGDDEAGRAIFKRYAPLLVRVLYRRLRGASDAEDLVQQAFLQLHRARRDYRPGMRLRPWLVTIAMNLSRDLQRRLARRPEVHCDVASLGALDEDPAELDTDIDARVRAAVSALPTDQRNVIELHWFQQRHFDEIASLAGVSCGAVRVRAHRGYVALRKALA